VADVTTPLYPPRRRPLSCDRRRAMPFHRSSHAVFECQYHVIWATKYRRRVMALPHEKEYCEKILIKATAKYGMNILMCEVDEDHVHLQIEIPPQRSVGDGVGILKNVSARMMFKRFSYFRRKLWAGQFWGDSYFARTIGEGVNVAMVRRYIDKHAEKGLEPTQMSLFRKEK
jgi:putative transposase